MSYAIRSNTVGSRSDLALLCNDRHHKWGAEIGTDRGLFAREFLDKWTGETLYCVDNYQTYPEMPWGRQGDLLMATSLLAPHAHRVRMLLLDASTVARHFLDTGMALDVIYNDGAHDPASITRDIADWWPLLRPGGLFSGDDYDRANFPGVVQAVHAHADAHGLDVQLTTDYNRAPSWFMEKAR